MSEVHWFLTVDWCKQGKRGLFCSRGGRGYWALHPHREDEIYSILGAFELVLSAKSLPFTEEELKGWNTGWVPLAEYRSRFGYAVIPEDVLATVTARAAEMTASPVGNLAS